jgi:predicted fused transcriptional regulator/phosphomethylpyrimidine kinase
VEELQPIQYNIEIIEKKNKNKEYVPEATTNIAHVCPFRGTL